MLCAIQGNSSKLSVILGYSALISRNNVVDIQIYVIVDNNIIFSKKINYITRYWNKAKW